MSGLCQCGEDLREPRELTDVLDSNSEKERVQEQTAWRGSQRVSEDNC